MVLGQGVLARGRHRDQALAWVAGARRWSLVTLLPGDVVMRVELGYAVGSLVVVAALLRGVRCPRPPPAPALERVAMRVTAVMLAYGPEPWLADAVGAVLASTGVEVDLVLVDNGAPRAPSTSSRASRGCGSAAGRQHRVRRRLPARRGRGDRGVPRLRQLRRDRLAARRWPGWPRSPRSRGSARRRARSGSPTAGADQLGRQPAALRRALLGRRQRRTGRPRTPPAGSVPSVSGCCFVVRRELWRAAGRLRRGVLRLPRGRRAEPTDVAAGPGSGVRARGGRFAPLRVLPQRPQVLPGRAQPADHPADRVTRPAPCCCSPRCWR